MSSARLEGKTIIVTGGGSGIGETAGKLFAQHGAQVVLADINPGAAERVAKEIDAEGGTAFAVGVDVTNLADNEAMIEATVEKFGKIDGIYVNAGVPGGHTAHGITAEEWQHVIAVNLTGAFYSAKAAVPVFLKQGHGNILFQASICATSGIKGTVSYSASKAGVVGLTYQMAIEYADQGIRVNSLSPGTTPTPFVQKLYTERAAIRGTTAEGDLERTAGSYPMKRLGTTEEIANLALFMLSDESSFITGADIPVDGGFSAG
ncbi:SDR family NAD(P)-dependent oxidoreductase [Paenarthrobacter sp. NPDC057981]|uniref:SDR family NAD(P)-dependent oxidoreductase n=1 Tax=Paenarthrobacter sp. NPDC057981 TaxID=3346297 RepID=UPI0036DF8BB4